MVASFPGILRRESFIVSFLAFFTLLLSPTKSSYTFKEPFGNFARKELIARDFAFFAIFSGSNALPSATDLIFSMLSVKFFIALPPHFR